MVTDHPSPTPEGRRCPCGDPATCYGTYEGVTGYGCDVCCGHGNEDGRCTPLPTPAPEGGEWAYTREFNEDGTEKHVTREGARYHVLSWSTQGTRCSEPNCEVNGRPSPTPASTGEEGEILARMVEIAREGLVGNEHYTERPGLWIATTEAHAHTVGQNVEDLRRQLAEAEERAKRWWEKWEIQGACAERHFNALTASQQEVARLREALREYGRHNGGCNLRNPYPFTAKARAEYDAKGCTCGLRAALSTPQQGEEQGA